MVRLLFPFILGIVAASYFKPINYYLYLSLSLSFLLYIVWIYGLKKQKSYKNRWVSGFLIGLNLFFLGYVIVSISNPKNDPFHYSHYSPTDAYVVKISAPFTETPKTHKSVGEIQAVRLFSDSNWHKATGKILLYFEKQNHFNLAYGDELVVSSVLNSIQGPQNPEAFNYQKYMQLKGIYHQSFIKSTDWVLTKKQQTITLISISNNLRNKLLSIIKNLHYSVNEEAIAAALLIGYDEYLNDDLRAQFSGSGAMHILCVSGLHVGIIYMLSSFLLGFLGKLKYGETLKTVFILSIIWMYALVTGLSPSVMRASTMFSFMLLGKAINRSGNAYNSLAASAFFLLLINPNLLYNIGFQLSYSAVFAILAIQPKLYSFLYIRNTLLQKIWALITVSIAAQLGTFPLAVYYFHQFPNYFLLTNLWVIPLAFWVVTNGMIVLVIGLLGWSAGILGTLSSSLLYYSLLLLTKGVELINSLPFAVSDKLYFSGLQLFIIYLLIFSLVRYFLYQKLNGIFLSLFSVLVLVLSSTYMHKLQKEEKTWIVYKTKGYSAMDFIQQQQSVLIGDSGFVKCPDEQKFVLNEFHLKKGIQANICLSSLDTTQYHSGVIIHNKLILFDSLKIIYLNDFQKNISYSKPMQVDYIVLAHDALFNLKQLQKQYTFKYLIFDASNNWWKTKKLRQQALEMHIPYWDVQTNGAFALSLSKTKTR